MEAGLRTRCIWEVDRPPSPPPSASSLVPPLFLNHSLIPYPFHPSYSIPSPSTNLPGGGRRLVALRRGGEEERRGGGVGEEEGR